MPCRTLLNTKHSGPGPSLVVNFTSQQSALINSAHALNQWRCPGTMSTVDWTTVLGVYQASEDPGQCVVWSLRPQNTVSTEQFNPS